ncbi:MAG: branched-chain amino acid ABC transporter permease [Desulfobacteraceae bacterium]|nr:MAG: branched-chain amino acid ABC transporter permease [Desulfobacteraceae bacterium]
MAEFLQYTVNGLIAGSSYGLLALAMTLIYGILSVPNFALGGIYALGAFIAFYVVQWLGPGYYLFSLVPAVLIGTIIAIVTERLVFRPLHDAPHAAGFIAALGLYSILEGGWAVWFDPTWKKVTSPYNDIILKLGPVSLTLQRLVILVICLLFAVGTYVLVYRTLTGKKIRAASEDKNVAQLLGISPYSTTTMTFIVGCALAGIAGVLDAPTALVGASMGMTPITKAFIVVALGGLGSVTGAIVGGLILGLGENYGAAYISSMYKDLFSYGLFTVVLLLLPHGLYRR